MDQHTKYLVDLTAAVAVIGTLVDWLPDIAALFTIIWYMIRIWESDTVKAWRGKSSAKRK